MRPEDWSHLSIGLEVAAFFFVTPQFLGAATLKRISSSIAEIAEAFVALLNFLIFGRSSPSEAPKVLAVLPELVASYRQSWRKSPLIPVTILAGPLLAIAVILLTMSRRYRLWGYAIAGGTVLIELSLIASLRHLLHSFLPRMAQLALAKDDKRVSFTLGRGASLVFDLLLSIFQSFAIWGFMVPAYVLLKLSETDRLRNYLFWTGVLAFLSSKAIEYAMVR
jgi:hypothetical protein